MSKKQPKLCPRCGTPMDAPDYGMWDTDVCQACGWGAIKPLKPKERVELPHLILFWFAVVTLLSMTALPFLIYGKFSFNYQLFEAASIFFLFWTLYALIGGLIEVKVDFDWLCFPFGFLIDLRSTLLLLSAVLLLPGRVMYMAFEQTLRYAWQENPRRRKKKRRRSSRKYRI